MYHIQPIYTLCNFLLYAHILFDNTVLFHWFFTRGWSVNCSNIMHNSSTCLVCNHFMLWPEMSCLFTQSMKCVMSHVLISTKLGTYERRYTLSLWGIIEGKVMGKTGYLFFFWCLYLTKRVSICTTGQLCNSETCLCTKLSTARLQIHWHCQTWPHRSEFAW
jgi:hypothetical protein